MHGAHARGDWRAFRASALKLSRFLNGSPDALLEVARADARLGDQAEALEQLRAFVGAGQSNEILKTLADFAPLRTSPDFKKILDGMASNLVPVTHATLAFVIPDAGLLPEDIDYDPRSRRFFLSSVLEKKLVGIDASGRIADFAQAPDQWPLLALKVDAQRRLLWATEVALDGFASVPRSDWGRSVVLGYDIDNGKLLRCIEGPPHSALGDIALGTDGNLVISDGAAGGVYLAQGDTLKRADKGDFISPQTPAFSPDNKSVFVPDYTRGIGVLAIATGQVRWFAMEGKYALQGIDGLYFHGGSLIATQNGTTPERVVTFELDSMLNRVRSEQTIEAAAANLDPTHGVIVGREFYYITNSGWSALDDSGKVKKGAVLTPARIMRSNLPN